jgi:hypothetical protein
MPEQFDLGVEVTPAADEVPFVAAQVYAECPICGVKTGDLDEPIAGTETVLRLCDNGEEPFRHGNWPDTAKTSKSKKK